jgi:hypothetical protein
MAGETLEQLEARFRERQAEGQDFSHPGMRRLRDQIEAKKRVDKRKADRRTEQEASKVNPNWGIF